MFYSKILIFLLFIFCLLPKHAFSVPRTLEELSSISAQLHKTNVPYGAISSFYRPIFGRMMDADLTMSAQDPVFIVLFPEGARIYPQRIMVWHQVANEHFGQNAYAVTYCPITGTLVAYNSVLDGTALYFDVEGRLYGGNSVLIDRNTGSLWLQAIGMAFEGPLTGRGLAHIPVFWTTWEAAKKVFPDTPVLSAPSGSRKAYGRDPYGNYLKTGNYYDNDVLAYPVRYKDLRIPHKNEVIGLEFPNFRLAIDTDYVKKQGAVNFFLGPNALLAVHDMNLDVVRVYNRQVWDKPSLFVLQYGKLIDIATKSTWDVATGKALEGNMKDASMQQYFGIYSMWFSWFNFHPETALIPGPGEVSKDVLHLDTLSTPQQNPQ